MRVLYVSESLGTPSRSRGIFNFSISFVELLNGVGARVDLVIENNRWLKSVKRLQAAEVAQATYQYLATGRFDFAWDFRSRRYRIIFAALRPLLQLWFTVCSFAVSSPSPTVRSNCYDLGKVSDKNRNLQLFDGLVAPFRFYYRSLAHAVLGLSPPVVDASAYDLVVVDAPQFIAVKGVSPQRIWTVIHDLIPLHSSQNEAKRRLFLRRLNATLALGGKLIFVSRATQDDFHATFASHKTKNEYLIYPAIRSNLAEMAQGAALRSAPRPAGLQTSGQAPEDEVSGGDARRLSSCAGTIPAFDLSLPYFVTVTSDEPHKNIETVTQAFYRQLRGLANLVVLGDIDSRRYDAGPQANIFFAGYVSDAEKVAYFGHACGLIFASLHEGFGIPLIEGAVLGLPVLCSNIDVFREIARDHAFYFDPGDCASLAGAVKASLADPETAARRAAALRKMVLARFSQATIEADVRAALADLPKAD